MNRARKLAERHVGPGGWGCACCAPAPGSRARRLVLRAAKRQDKILAIKEGLAAE